MFTFESFTKALEETRHASESGRATYEFWCASELAERLGYSGNWSAFLGIVERAKEKCAMFGVDPEKHFVAVRKNINCRPFCDVHLSRAACYLIGMGCSNVVPLNLFMESYKNGFLQREAAVRVEVTRAPAPLTAQA